MPIEKKKLKKLIDDKLLRHFGCYSAEATKQQLYRAISLVTRDLLVAKRKNFENKVNATGEKQVYYMSMEFLVGTSLRNNLYNLSMLDEMQDLVNELGYDVEELYEIEPDAGLGNGGLGRLASCYMDSMTTKEISCTGFSIRYEFGIFKQKIIDGWQMEFPDNWLEMGDVWLIPRQDEAVEVRFGGKVVESWSNDVHNVEHVDYTSVMAVPYDMMISGYETDAVNELILWSAKSPSKIDMSLFSRGEYVKSMEKNAMAEAISKVLYPADDHWEGKALRLKQQYLLVCASLKSIIGSHMKKFGIIELLPQKVAIHINDTHPALCVPELMRVLLDEFKLSWEKAWDITSKTLAYTNHTVMSEALERWPVSLFSQLLPRVYQIVREIDRRFNNILLENYAGDNAKINYMRIVADEQVKMANLCLACCHKVNGVAKMHSDILKNDLFKDFYYIMPDKFTNVTNGIAYRRWLCQSNPRLTALIMDLIGEGFTKDAQNLVDLLKYQDDKDVLDELAKIKLENKKVLAKYISVNNGVNVDPTSIFDIQVKRLHEYKRQLLNVLHILYLYNKIKENPDYDIEPRTFIFGAKASPGYMMAKQIIRLINCVASQINSDPIVRNKIKVIFAEDYKVSLAEIIIPAAEFSQQISVAGKEASGTGNMKLMINGAITVGTLDGANVEILEAVGNENIFIFGMTAQEVVALWQKGYNPFEIYNGNDEIRKIVDMLKNGINGIDFSDIAYSLTQGSYGSADSYMTLADFDAYKNAQHKANDAYKDRDRFNKMSLINIAKAGVFSSDRSVMEYAKNIWEVK